jgi:hypothetical protein
MRNPITSRNRASRHLCNTPCLVESLEGRICMTASITVDPFHYEFGVFEHETIGFANKTGGPILAVINCKDIPQDPAQFQVSLAWGDGTVTKGGVVIEQIDEGGDAPFVWYATLGDLKTFGDPGKLPVNISINQVGHPEVNATAQSAADVEEYPIRPHGRTVNANTSPRDLTNVTVATFEDGFLNSNPPTTDLFGKASNFAATIDWGDGTVSQGTIISVIQTKGLYLVNGTHYYNGLTAHTYPVKVHIVETATGNDGTADSTATVFKVPLYRPINVITAPLNPFSSTPVTKVWDL